MKHHSPSDESSRFSSNLRHYHRSGAPSQRSWEDWVEGPGSKPKSGRRWVRILGILAGVLVLGGIATGLVIGLR